MIDKQQLIGMLRESAGRFVACFESLGQAQFHFKPGPSRWSIAETAEHVIMAETGSGKLMAGRLVREPASAELLVASQGAEKRIDDRLLNRAQGFPSPEFVLPTGRWQTPAEMVTVFTTSRMATIRILEEGEKDLAKYVAPHPVFGPLNGYQWAYFLVRHGDRHVEQIEEIKQVDGYPG